MSRLPALLDSLRELLTRWSAALEARGIPLGDMQAELFSRISAAAGQLAATLVSGIRRLTGSVSQWLLAPLLSFYFLRDRKRLCLLLSLVLPVKYRARGIRAAREMRRESALYLRGQLILSRFVAAMTALALLLTRTPGALLLGLFMGVMELIPYIGPFIAGVPAVLLALQSGWTAALWTLLAICLVQQVEANLLSPRLLSGATRLHPLAVLLAIAFGGMAGGRVWGALFFVFMSFAALSTVIAVFENIVAFGMDLWGWSRKKAVLVNFFAILVLSLPCVLGYNVLSGFMPFGEGSAVLDLEDFLVSNTILPLGSLVYLLFCTSRYGWGWKNFVAEADEGKGIRFPKWARVYVSYILPLIVLFIFLMGYKDKFFT